MHKRDDIETLFDRLDNEFDVYNANDGHEKRFLEKLQKNTNVVEVTKKQSWFKPLMAAASILLIIALGTFLLKPSEITSAELASVSPEMEEAQSFFTATIEKELSALKKLENPVTKAIINDAIKRLDLLDTEYQSLKNDLVESGNDKRVINAMIENFQKRISLLQLVLDKIEEIKKLNNNNDEINI